MNVNPSLLDKSCDTGTPDKAAREEDGDSEYHLTWDLEPSPLHSVCGIYPAIKKSTHIHNTC